MSQIDDVQRYWNVLSRAVSDEYKDHWVDDDGTGLKEALFEEVAEYLSEFVVASGMARVLEVGCGTGRILNQLTKRFDDSVSLTGIDFSQPQIEAAQGRLGERVQLYVCDLAGFAEKGMSGYDLIYVHSVTQYFPGDAYFTEFLEYAYALLNQGGVLVLVDCPIDWYKEQMLRQPSGLLHKLKQLVKKLLRYERKTAQENIGGVSISVPVFKGYWVNPAQVRAFAEMRFDEFKMEYQMFRSKPVGYKKFRPNFILKGKLQ